MGSVMQETDGHPSAAAIREPLAGEHADPASDDLTLTFGGNLSTGPRRALAEAERLAHLLFTEAPCALKKELRTKRALANVVLIVALLLILAPPAFLVALLISSVQGTPSRADQVIANLPLAGILEFSGFSALLLYRWLMNAVTHLQAELVTIDTWKSALVTAVYTDDLDLLRSVVRRRSESDRNPILQPGQSTVELERARRSRGWFPNALWRGRASTSLTRENPPGSASRGTSPP